MPDSTVGKPLEQIRFAREQRHGASRAERVLWGALRNGQLGARFRRQHPCSHFVLDFYCSPAKLAVEVDGPSHGKQVSYDRWRDEQLEGLGIRVLRFSTETVETSLVLVLDEIRAALGERLTS